MQFRHQYGLSPDPLRETPFHRGRLRQNKPSHPSFGPESENQQTAEADRPLVNRAASASQAQTGPTSQRRVSPGAYLSCLKSEEIHARSAPASMSGWRFRIVFRRARLVPSNRTPQSRPPASNSLTLAGLVSGMVNFTVAPLPDVHWRRHGLMPSSSLFLSEESRSRTGRGEPFPNAPATNSRSLPSTTPIEIQIRLVHRGSRSGRRSGTSAGHPGRSRASPFSSGLVTLEQDLMVW